MLRLLRLISVATCNCSSRKLQKTTEMHPWENKDCKLLEADINAFVMYLYNAGCIVNFTVDYNVAEKNYNEHFKKPKISFKRFVRAMTNLCIILVRRNTALVFVERSLNNIIKYAGSGSRLEGISAMKSTPRRTVIVSQAAAFKEQRKPEDLVGETACNVCNVTFKNHSDYETHLLDVRHVLRSQYITERRSAFVSHHPDIVIEVAEEHGNNNESLVLKINEEIALNIKNKSDTDYELKDIIQLNLENPEIVANGGRLPVVLKAKNQLRQVIYSASKGVNNSVVYPQVFILRNLGDDTECKILKQLILHVEPLNVELFKALLPNGPYQPQKATYSDYTEEIIPGLAVPPSQSGFQSVVALADYKLSGDIVKVLNKGLKKFEGITSDQTMWLNYIKDLLDTPDHANSLNPENYYSLLEMLLYLEEHQMQRDIHDYDRNDAILKLVKGRRNLYSLEVPGLAEHRPSLIRGDSVFVKTQSDSPTKFQGIVHNVKETHVELGFNQRFSKEAYIQNKKYCIYFTFNRYTLRVEHQAVYFTRKNSLAPYLFPTELPIYDPPEIQHKWFEQRISTNAQQQRAVRKILVNSSYPAPFLIFGPPGTGKTMTLVEAVKQVWKLKPQAKILVCAPSNNAANEVTKRLVQNIPSTDLLRYLATSYNYNELPPEMVTYANYTRGEFYHPTIGALMKYRIVVSTLVNAARLVNAGIPADHFSYVFIDESGHATETETLCAIAGILYAKERGILSGQIVLAGDPKQLGPIIHSKLANEYGFGTSMLERMMKTLPLYQKDKNGMYNPRVLVKLLKNYRSHEAILHIPNKLFYEGELTAHGDNLIKLGLNWQSLPNPKFPILFHSVNGIDEREQNSPSFFNVLETVTVCDYLKKLIGTRLSGMLIKQEHIAIVSPYRKQVEKLKRACASHNWKNLTIGSVEQMQGQERLIVIVTTVRSRAAFMKFDAKFNLGFLNNEKRFNVALTRAKALLIVVGNADILQLDPNWKQFIDYCIDNDGYKGKLPSRPPSRLEGGEEELAAELEQLHLDEGRNVAETASFQRGNI